MIGLGVGIDYALFIVTRFRENYLAGGDVQEAIIGAMDTAGRAVLFAGATVIIALLGQFALGVDFLYGLAVSSALAVLMTMLAALTVLPALLSRFGERIGRTRKSKSRDAAPAGAEARVLGPLVGIPRAPPVGGSDRGARDHVDTRLAGARDEAGQQRRRQQPAEPDHAPGI